MGLRYVISDIHGEYELFLALLDKIKFTDNDTLYVCGDIVEKGKNSIRLSKFISQMQNAKCIVGNHEYAFLKYYWGLMRNWGITQHLAPVSNSSTDFDDVLEKLQGYFPDDGHLLDWELVDWFEALPYYIEEDDFVCVHAGVPLDNDGKIFPLEHTIPEQLVYDRTFKEKNVGADVDKCVFFGHTPTSYLAPGDSKILAYLRPQRKGDKISDYYKVHLDLGAWISKTLGCFCIETCECIYVKK